MRLTLNKFLIVMISMSLLNSCGSDEEATNEQNESSEFAGTADKLVGEATKEDLIKAEAPKQALTRVKVNKKGEVIGQPETVFMQTAQNITSQNVQKLFKSHKNSQLNVTSANSWQSNGKCQNVNQQRQTSQNWKQRSFNSFSNCKTPSFQKPVQIQRPVQQQRHVGQQRQIGQQRHVQTQRTNVNVQVRTHTLPSYQNVSGCNAYSTGSYNIGTNNCQNIGNYVRPTYFMSNPRVNYSNSNYSYNNTNYNSYSSFATPIRNFLGGNRNYSTPIRNFLRGHRNNTNYARPYLATRYNNYSAVPCRTGNYAYYRSW